MKKMMTFWMMLLIALSAFGQNSKGGGNGQLVVIPNGEVDPVPYEMAKSWDSGVYRNFYQLPNVNGNIERREKFNRMYGVHALKWMEILKSYAPKLHKDLEGAAKATKFRILSNYILWEHEPYPNGEVDYGTYEKAAFYNGEIIFSTLVMDKIGKLGNVLTKEENQGFVVIHELINAAYPFMKIEDKLRLGELIANIKILGWSKVQFLAETMNEDSLFDEQIKSVLNDKNDIFDALHELGTEVAKRKLRLMTSVEEIESNNRILESSPSYQEGIVSIIENYKANGDSDDRALTKTLYFLDAFQKIGFPGYLTLDTYRAIDSRFTINWSEFQDMKTYRDYSENTLFSRVTGDYAFSIIQKERREEIIKERSERYLKLADSDFFERDQNLMSLYYWKSNPRDLIIDDVSQMALRYETLRSKNNYGLTHSWRASGYETKLKEKFESVYKKILNKLKIKNIFPGKKESLSFEDDMKVKLISCEKDITLLGLNQNETYLVKRINSSKVVLKIQSSPEQSRLKKKIKIPRPMLHACSIAEMI